MNNIMINIILSYFQINILSNILIYDDRSCATYLNSKKLNCGLNFRHLHSLYRYIYDINGNNIGHKLPKSYKYTKMI